MVRPRLYGRGDIHNRELRRRRIKPIVGIVRHTFTESLALGNAGLSIYRNYSPKKFFRKFYGWHSVNKSSFSWFFRLFYLPLPTETVKKAL